MTMLEPDRDQIEIFVEALFRYARPANVVVSLRAFYEDEDKAFRITPVRMTGGLRFLNDVAVDDARRAAQHPDSIVFAPPVATFSTPDGAAESDLAQGLELLVECDQQPQQARRTLEQLLGTATIVVASGGQWLNGGAPEPKLHLHWRLRVPACTEADLKKLKQARSLAARLVGADPTSTSVVHPIRWPGSWHRKGEPISCHIEHSMPITKSISTGRWRS